MGGDDERPGTLYHYTDEEGLAGIMATGLLLASTLASSPSDARYGSGQYLSEVEPGSKSPAQLSRLFLGHPFQGRRFTRFIEINVTGLELIHGRPGVWLVPNDGPLDLTGRFIRRGPLPGGPA